jgi:dihydroorotase-like cyclic amidohydrolase
MTLPLLLSRLAMPTLVRLATTAATILRLPAKGSLTTGADGDIVLVDPMSEWDVGTDTLWTRHRMSPFAGWRVRGRVVRTFVRGRTVFTLDDGPGPPGGGMVVRPSA